MPIVEADRSIAADPTSVALLLNGPAAGELWPGVVEVDSSSARLALRARVPGRGTVDARVTVTPVRSMPTSYGATFTIESDALPPMPGRLNLSYESPGSARRTTRAVIVIDYRGPYPERLRRLAQRYLDNVAAAAETRPTTV